jgi:hypothetical protein
MVTYKIAKALNGGLWRWTDGEEKVFTILGPIRAGRIVDNPRNGIAKAPDILAVRDAEDGNRGTGAGSANAVGYGSSNGTTSCKRVVSGFNHSAEIVSRQSQGDFAANWDGSSSGETDPDHSGVRCSRNLVGDGSEVNRSTRCQLASKLDGDGRCCQGGGGQHRVFKKQAAADRVHGRVQWLETKSVGVGEVAVS